MQKKVQATIAENIKKYRILNNMTQKDLAEKLFLDTQYYAQLERGERNFSIEKIAMICSIFQIGIEDIIEIEVPATDDTSELVSSVTVKLSTLSRPQLVVLDQFISTILLHIK